jgi:hypothetical protein
MITVGDIVMVVRPSPCCGDTGGLGIPQTVVHTEVMPLECRNCGASVPETLGVFWQWEGREMGAPHYLLIKINPPKVKAVERAEEFA